MLGLIVSLVLMQAPTGGAAAPATAAPTASAAPAVAPASAPVAVPAATGAPIAKPGTAPATPATQQPPPSMMQTLLMFSPAVVLFYLMILRPQQKQEKKRKETINKIAKNDKVITAGGIYGTVVSVDGEGDMVTLRLGSDPGVKVEFTKASIVRVIAAGDKKD